MLEKCKYTIEMLMSCPIDELSLGIIMPEESKSNGILLQMWANYFK
jgi:hypothetical protein